MSQPNKDGKKSIEGRDARRRFSKGNSCSPGRPPGRGRVAELRDKLATDLDQIINTLRERAREVDLMAIRILLDRVLPSLKPVELPATVGMPANASLSDQARSVVASIAAGQVTPSEGATVLSALASLGKIVEIDELTARIEKLEGGRNEH